MIKQKTRYLFLHEQETDKSSSEGRRATSAFSETEYFLNTALNAVSEAESLNFISVFACSLKKTKTKSILIPNCENEIKSRISKISLHYLIFQVASVMFQSLSPNWSPFKDLTRSINRRCSQYRWTVQDNYRILHKSQFS